MNQRDARREFVLQIKRQADILTVVQDYVSLELRSTGDFWGCCPFHTEKTASFHVVPAGHYYHCFGCGVKGDAIDFVQNMEALTFLETVQRLGERFSVPFPGAEILNSEEKAEERRKQRLYDAVQAASKWFSAQLKIHSNPRDYLYGRDFTDETIERFSLGYAPDSWDSLYLELSKTYTDDELTTTGLFISGSKGLYDRFRHRVIFPIADERGRCIAFGGRFLDKGRFGTDVKYVNSPESELFSKGKVLYNLHNARPTILKNKNIVITEGYMDAIALNVAGYENVVAVLGTALTTWHSYQLARLNAKRVHLCFDSDTAGLKAVFRAGGVLQRAKTQVRVVDLPPGEDPDSFIKAQGKRVFNSKLRNSVDLTTFVLQRLLAEHNIEDQTGWAAVLREASEIISEIPLASERTHYIEWLVGQWVRVHGEDYRSQSMIFGDALRRSVVAIIRRKMGRKDDTGPDYIKEALDMPGVHRAESSLMGAVLHDPGLLESILEEVPVERWSVSEHREIIQGFLDAGSEAQPVDVLPRLSEKASRLLTQTLVSASEMEYDEELLEQLVQRVSSIWESKSAASTLGELMEKVGRGETLTEEERATYRKVMSHYSKCS